MATSTTNYSFTLPEIGGDTDQWGSQLNANWTLADSTLKTIQDSVVDVTLTGNDYLTISGQAITVGNVDLTTDVTGTLPVASGGTGLAALGSANQVLGVNSGGTALEYKTLSTGGTVTSVAVTGSDGIEIDSGSPITSSGTIALGINSTSLSTHLGLGSLATQSAITESQISDLQSYLTAEVNDLSAAVTGTLGTANGGTGLTSIGTAGQVLKVNSGATALEFADESGGGGSSSNIEHSSTVSDSLAISAGTNRMYIGNTAFSGSGTMAGYLVISHGYANFTGASAFSVTGTLNVVS